MVLYYIIRDYFIYHKTSGLSVRNDVLHGQDLNRDAPTYILWQNATCFFKHPGFVIKNTNKKLANLSTNQVRRKHVLLLLKRDFWFNPDVLISLLVLFHI